MSVHTIKQVGEKLGISVSLVYREIRDGRLKCHRFGRRAYRVSDEELAAYIEACALQRMAPTADNTPTDNQLRTKGQELSAFRHINVSRLLARRN